MTIPSTIEDIQSTLSLVLLDLKKGRNAMAEDGARAAAALCDRLADAIAQLPNTHPKH